MLDSLYDQLAASSGLGADQLKYLTCMLLTIPLGLVFRMLPRNQVGAKKAFGALVGVFFR